MELVLLLCRSSPIYSIHLLLYLIKQPLLFHTPHLKYLKLMNHLFIEVNPIPVKAAMNLMGLNVGPMRMPLCAMSPANEAVLRETMKEVGPL